MSKKKTTDAVEIMDKRYGGTPEWDEMVQEENLKLRVGIAVYNLRKEAGLTQKQLADTVGITQAMVSQVENADYEGSALEMLWRICRALHKELDFSCREPGSSKESCQVALSPA